MVSDSRKLIPLIGYTDRLSVRPGETIDFKISSQTNEPVRAWLTRSISADPNPDGQGIVEWPQDAFFEPIAFEAGDQAFASGSYVITDQAIDCRPQTGFQLGATLFPTLMKSVPQIIISVGQLALMLDDGVLCLRIGEQRFVSTHKIAVNHWVCVEARFDAVSSTIQLTQWTPGKSQKKDENSFSVCVDALPKEMTARVSIAACMKGKAHTDHFNGKIEAPFLQFGDEERLQWDFSQDISTTRIIETSSRKLDGLIRNFPARAVTGSNWNSEEMCWRHAPGHYGAIHFHETDIYDFEWDTSFSFSIPDDLPSGVYVMRMKSGIYEDAMPFFVCAPFGKPTAKLCVLVSTFTYVIYGNHARPGYDPSWQERVADWKAYPYNPAEYPAYGHSTYNFHSDNSGICHASHLRPLLNLRPGYLTFGSGEGSGLRHLQADSHLISWLHSQNIDFDLITDQELHDEGVAAIENYDCVITGSHPEYHTLETLDALQNYRDDGGHFCYLGGNGFYWRIVAHKQNSGILEIRRAEDGIRAWAAEPGEYYNAFDGSYGGLWRRNGRPPQMLCGVGFSAQGEFNGIGYQRACFDAQYEWVFEGVDSTIIGDFGFSGGGAAGFELDRAEPRLGTPDDAVILASSGGHGEDFILVPEEQLTHLTTWSGSPAQSMIRADMIYFDVPGGGSVFSTGSITFCGSLPWNNFQNNVSCILKNVIDKMTT
ncbi:N,N-dimethylformamidase beta subunit family domain-containing protein [Pararhizobium sp. IMCC21322]|uniref:N,N-dimethylformamidase beta subunit family domain-containing protein n=1 Tax=Pararhizobium sp. IMCC21322 TaxID=3067903 RepID=UPI002741E4F4|nr:N,N-dimethylformamidase beta subunit family domain-containing protein [Pararhizobium sp. IMCC21322]